jgi:carbohydrate-selective porin OprB
MLSAALKQKKKNTCRKLVAHAYASQSAGRRGEHSADIFSDKTWTGSRPGADGRHRDATVHLDRSYPPCSAPVAASLATGPDDRRLGNTTTNFFLRTKKEEIREDAGT